MATALPPSKQMGTTPAQTAEDLLTFAIDREDIKWCLARLPADATLNQATVDYELQILKIISVGWSLTYLLADSPQKDLIVHLFWKAVQEFSDHLSSTSTMMIGKDIDYFKILKGRFDLYLSAMAAASRQGSEPGRVIGEVFARLCGRAGDLATLMAGARMLTGTFTIVKKYLETTGCYE